MCYGGIFRINMQILPDFAPKINYKCHKHRNLSPHFGLNHHLLIDEPPFSQKQPEEFSDAFSTKIIERINSLYIVIFAPET